MGNVEVILALLAIIVIFAVATRKFMLPYPVVFLLGGLLLSLIPGLPQIQLDPHLVFLLFVPPILFAAAYFTSWRDFRANFRPITFLAIVLVGLTTVAVAATFKWLLPSMPWAVGCVLGAIISPPDATAAVAIVHRLKIPRRIITIIEGESLVNDASALILYKFAVAAVVTGNFSMTQASMQFVMASAGGVIVGLLIGWLIVKLTQHLQDVTIAITVTLLTPFIAFIFAERLGFSGILSVVTTGLVMGWHGPRSLTPSLRIKGSAVWETLIFLLNGMVFVLIGLQMPAIVAGLGPWSYKQLAMFTVAIVFVTVVIRFVWVFFSAYVLRWLLPWVRKRERVPKWQNVLIIAWVGMRGIVSLGAALALPFATETGAEFPARDLIIFLVFSSILGTLIFQGLTLPLLIRWLDIKDDEGVIHEELIARTAISNAMIEEVEKLKNSGAISESAYELTHRECTLYAVAMDNEEEQNCHNEVRSMRRRLLAAGRRKLLEIRHRGEIGDEVLHIIQSEFDLDELRLG